MVERLHVGNAAELRNTAVRSGTGTQVTYHDRERKNGVLASGALAKVLRMFMSFDE
jgi:hypothetical protein